MAAEKCSGELTSKAMGGVRYASAEHRDAVTESQRLELEPR
jgi:hypothetical protein